MILLKLNQKVLFSDSRELVSRSVDADTKIWQGLYKEFNSFLEVHRQSGIKPVFYPVMPAFIA